MPYLPIYDIVALALFFTGWAGYSTYADSLAHGKRPIAVVMND